MINKILGTVLFIMSGVLYTAEQIAMHRDDNSWSVSAFVPWFAVIGIILFISGMISKEKFDNWWKGS